MFSSYYPFFRPALFLLPPESAHRCAIQALNAGIFNERFSLDYPALNTHVGGVSFRSPIGLAAGFDKNAECYEAALGTGFGFVEIGTVTPVAQEGNPRPRVFRLTREEALINRLGFNNQGVDAAVARLRSRNLSRGIVGGNIGKNKDSADAIADYEIAMRALYPWVDYITVNVSSPNTPGLRSLQEAESLANLIQALHRLRDAIKATGAPHRPVFVKIAPDGEAAFFQSIAEVAKATHLEGLIISNTTLARDVISPSLEAKEVGGLSGKPLFKQSTNLLRELYRLTEGKIPLIGVGGIGSAEDAYAKIRAGASLVQLYTALVYQGFGLVARINEGLSQLLARDGFASVSEAVGVDALSRS